MQFFIPDFPNTITTYSVGHEILGARAHEGDDDDDDKNVTKLTNKYGVMGVDTFDLGDLTDGMNKKGLQCSALYLPDYAQYQTVPEDINESHTVIDNAFFCNWVLGRHASVKEVNASLADPNIFVVGGPIVPLMLKKPQPLHWTITDRKGNSIIVEYIKEGTLNIFNNYVGVLTNSPNYEWHLNNLRQYSYFNNFNPSSDGKFNGLELGPQGVWAQMQGLPGNLNGQSRFIRLALFSHFGGQPENIPDARKGLALVEHLIDVGQVVNGTLNEMAENGSTQADFSRWQTMYNLKDNIMYFRSYFNFVWAQIDFNKIDTDEGAESYRLNIYQDVEPIDLTSEMKPGLKEFEEEIEEAIKVEEVNN
eukprot:Awhi_evm1s5036